MGTGNPRGRPRKYESPEAFDKAVDAYVDQCELTGEPITWTGMALALGFCTRFAIDEYQRYRGFSDSVKRAKLIVENAYEKRLHNDRGSPSGVIFALKNMQWNDRQELTGADGKPLSGPVTPVINVFTRGDDAAIDGVPSKRLSDGSDLA